MESQPQPLTAEAERRLSTRIPANEKATLLNGHMGSATQCTLMDLCLDGCRVRADAEIRVDAGARVELAFSIAGTTFRLSGVTEWTGRAREVGVAFRDVSPRREAELVEALGELAETWRAKQAERMRADGVLKAAGELVQQRTAEFEAKAAREAAWRAEAEQAARETREAEERLKSSRKDLSEAEKAAQRLAWVAESESRAHTEVPVMAKDKGAPAGNREAAKTARGSQQSGPSRRERRQVERHGVDSTAIVFLLDVRANVRGRILDVSIGGCRIRFEERFPVGIYRRVEVEFLLDGLPFRLPGVVQSLHDRFTAGIRFVDLSERKREQLLFVIEEITEASREDEAQGG